MKVLKILPLLLVSSVALAEQIDCERKLDALLYQHGEAQRLFQAAADRMESEDPKQQKIVEALLKRSDEYAAKSDVTKQILLQNCLK